MAIRIRVVDGVTVAICAARSIPNPGDIYLDDAAHHALSTKFAADFNHNFDTDLPYEQQLVRIADIEESNNPARDEWDSWIADMQQLIIEGD